MSNLETPPMDPNIKRARNQNRFRNGMVALLWIAIGTSYVVASIQSGNFADNTNMSQTMWILISVLMGLAATAISFIPKDMTSEGGRIFLNLFVFILGVCALVPPLIAGVIFWIFPIGGLFSLLPIAIHRARSSRQTRLLLRTTDETGNQSIGVQTAMQLFDERNRLHLPSIRTSLSLAVTFLTFAAAGIGYRLLKNYDLHRTSLLFIGIPLILGLGLCFAPARKTAMGATVRGITLAILLSSCLLGEGLVCVLFAAPLIYGVGMMIALDSDNDWKRRNGLLMIVGFMILSLEGSCGHLSFTREQSVTVAKMVAASSADIRRALETPPRFDTALPTYLQLGFPRPQWITSEGIEEGHRWIVHFAGGEGQPGHLILCVVRSEARRIVFHAVDDSSKIADWVTWRDATVSWTPNDNGTTSITWTIDWKRRVDPKWYFAPLQHLAVKLAASYLIDNLATPRITDHEAIRTAHR